MARYIMRRDGRNWRLWDRDQKKWRGKGNPDTRVVWEQHLERKQRRQARTAEPERPDSGQEQQQ